MKIFGSFLFLIGLTASAWAVAPVPAPDIAGGVVGMTLAAGIVYLVNRRKRR